MKDVCVINQNITDKFKEIDNEKYREDYEEHCHKISIIDSYEEEIKEVLFLSSGCVDKTTHSFKKYGLGLRPDYINLERLLDNVQQLKSDKLGLDYISIFGLGVTGFMNNAEEYRKYSLDFIGRNSYREYTDYLIEKVNKYSKEFYNKKYFLRCEGSFLDSYYTLVTKDETWKMEYLRHPDTLKRPFSFTIATLIPVLGWLVVLYSLTVAAKLYLKHQES